MSNEKTVRVVVTSKVFAGAADSVAEACHQTRVIDPKLSEELKAVCLLLACLSEEVHKQELADALKMQSTTAIM